MADLAFAARIREHFPEGLTGVIYPSGTRTSYILEKNRDAADPGKIEDPAAFAAYLLERYFSLASMYYELGGQNLFIPGLRYQLLFERGQKYVEMACKLSLTLISEKATHYYSANDVDPFFVGVDTLLTLPKDGPEYKLGAALDGFRSNWPYRAERRKLFWELGSNPLLSLTRASLDEKVRQELAAELAAVTKAENIQPALYRIYARAIYGIDVPMPHFYLGTNRNGDFKVPLSLPIGLGFPGSFRLYYTPYPSLNMTKESLKAVLEDLAFGKVDLRANDIDYSGIYTPELANAEYRRVVDLSADTGSVVGLLRRIAR